MKNLILILVSLMVVMPQQARARLVVPSKEFGQMLSCVGSLWRGEATMDGYEEDPETWTLFEKVADGAGKLQSYRVVTAQKSIKATLGANCSTSAVGFKDAIHDKFKADLVKLKSITDVAQKKQFADELQIALQDCGNVVNLPNLKESLNPFWTEFKTILGRPLTAVSAPTRTSASMTPFEDCLYESGRAGYIHDNSTKTFMSRRFTKGSGWSVISPTGAFDITSDGVCSRQPNTLYDVIATRIDYDLENLKELLGPPSEDVKRTTFTESTSTGTKVVSVGVYPPSYKEKFKADAQKPITVCSKMDTTAARKLEASWAKYREVAGTTGAAPIAPAPGKAKN